MGKLLLFVTLLFSSFFVFSQCPSTNIVLNTQEAIDDFAINYPNCTKVSTNITIQGSEVTNLNGLNSISSISGNLVIGGFNLGTSLTNLSGLDNLEFVSGRLDINRNQLLTTLIGLGQLKEVGSSKVGSGFSIFSNPLLEDLEGLNALTAVNNFFNIDNNIKLISLNGLRNLVNLNLGPFLQFSIQENNSLTDLIGLEGLTSIEGNLFIRGNKSLINLSGLVNLRNIKGKLTIQDEDDLTSLNGMNSLQTIGGDLQVETNISLVDFTGFNSLRKIDGNVRIAHNDGLINFNGINNLISIGGELEIFGNDGIENFTGLESLKEIGDNVEIRANTSLKRLLGLSSIKSLNGKLTIRDNISLETLEGLVSLDSIALDLQVNNNPSLMNLNGLESLKSVGRLFSLSDNESVIQMEAIKNLNFIGLDLDIARNASLLSLKGLENIIRVKRNLVIISNSSLQNLYGLDNLKSTGRVLVIRENESLTSLDGLESLEKISDSLGSSFELRDNPILNNISALKKLSNINGDLELENNDSLIDFSGLESLNQINGTLSIKENNNLQSLSGIQNIDNESVTNLILENNRNLVVCEALNICNYLSDNKPNSVLNNAIGCNAKEEIQSKCGEAFNLITGQILYDENGNGCDLADYLVQNRLVKSSNGIKTFSSVTDSTGVFKIFASEGSYETTAFLNEDYFELAPLKHYSNFEGLITKDTINFCVQRKIEAKDLEITLIPISEARPGFGVRYALNYQNNGTELLTGTISLQYDDSKLFFLDSSETEVSQTNNSLIFDYIDLIPFETRKIFIDFEVFAPPVVNLDEILEFTTIINPTTTDFTPEDNVFTLKQIIVGSYDPNDITVLEGDSIPIANKDEFLNYVIRFQNTGTASAINVQIDHELDLNLDWETFTPLSSSHTNTITMTNGKDVEFLFENINLPDSTANEPASHGHIAFKIKPKSDITVGDIIKGKASIFFDFNPPIITNEVTTEVIEEIQGGFIVNASLLKPISCKGLDDAQILVEASGGLEPYSYELLDETYNVLINSQTSNVFGNLSSGNYVVRVTDGSSRQVDGMILTITESNSSDFDNDGLGDTCDDDIDGDGVLNENDNCSETVLGSAVGSDGCASFTLPINNFSIQTMGESCISSDNGSILITAVENLSYQVTLTGRVNTISKDFTTSASFEELSSGQYEVCITVVAHPEYEKCFTVQITEPEALSVSSKIDTSGKSVSLTLSGGTNYSITLNGSVYSTVESEITLPLSEAKNNISVKTDKDCQGVYEDTFLLNGVLVYPNPVRKGVITISVVDNFKGTVRLSLFDNTMRLVMEKKHELTNGSITLSMDGFAAGIYSLRIGAENQTYIRKIIKE